MSISQSSQKNDLFFKEKCGLTTLSRSKKLFFSSCRQKTENMTQLDRNWLILWPITILYLYRRYLRKQYWNESLVAHTFWFLCNYYMLCWKCDVKAKFLSFEIFPIFYSVRSLVRWIYFLLFNVPSAANGSFPLKYAKMISPVFKFIWHSPHDNLTFF